MKAIYWLDLEFKQEIYPEQELDPWRFAFRANALTK